MTSLRWLVLGAAMAVSLASNALAHQLGQSYIFLRVYDDAIEARVEMTLADANLALGLGLPTDGTATEADLIPHWAAIDAYVHDRVHMTVDGDPVSYAVTGHAVMATSFAQYVQVDLALADFPHETGILGVDYNVLFDQDSEHRGLLVIWHNWRTGTFNNEAGVSLIFSPSNRSQELNLLEKASLWRGFGALVELGVHHIWVGIDHILFLLALLLPSVLYREEGRWRMVADFRAALIRVIKIVTLFTIAHSVTLSLAALGLVSIPSRIVESIIAISIAIAALDILFPIFHNRIWVVVFVFGLFHGFGFASVLGDLGVTQGHLALSLIGFNLGVELGQAAIVCALFPILFMLRSRSFYPRLVLGPAAVLLIVISMYWFVERAFNADLPAGAILKGLL